MSTAVNRSNPEPMAQGALRAQKLLAARIVRWLELSNGLALQIDQLPQFREMFTQFQVVLANAQAVHDRLALLYAEAAATMKQRNAVLSAGDDLFRRLSHALRAIHGPESPRLREFGLKPQARRGRRKKIQPVIPAPDPQGVGQ